MKLNIIFLFLLSISINTNAQTDFLVWDLDYIHGRSDSLLIHETHQSFDQFYLTLDDGAFKGMQWSINKEEWFDIQRNEHNDEVIISDLYFVPEGSSSIYIRNFQLHKAKLHFQQIKKIKLDHISVKERSTECDLPPMILQSEWRAGLPGPIPGRSGSKVKHLIIHHSAGENGREDYVNVVRAYYLYHINGNGWDDIGYNYLIDPFGVLYAGRDPLDSGVDQDNVIGAHLCAKNTNTMGVCVIGDYTDTLPSILARATLIHLLSWKVVKDTIDIFGTAIHPEGSGNLLDRIAGHRDGCSTSCPGDRFYPHLHEIKQEINAKVANCRLSTDINDLSGENHHWEVSPNPFIERITISSNSIQQNLRFNLLDQQGHYLVSRNLGLTKEIELDFSTFPSGIYYLQILSLEQSIVKKIIKL